MVHSALLQSATTAEQAEEGSHKCSKLSHPKPVESGNSASHGYDLQRYPLPCERSNGKESASSDRAIA